MVFEELRKRFMGNKELYPHLQDESDKRFGEIPGIPVFTHWDTRDAMRKAGMHTATVAGISGSQNDGAYSIVMSGGFIDDLDEGDFISYTGTGGTEGRDDSFGGDRSHRTDQSFRHPHNRALLKSAETGRPVRVIRGSSNPKSKYAPSSGYRYDGLYKVIRTYETTGQEGFKVCKFEMRRVEGQAPLPIRRVI